MRIVLGVAGGIAAYKAVLLLRLLREAGHEVRVVPTSAALEFVGAPTWEALSGRPARPDVFSGALEVDHVRIGREADLAIVAPATADLLARAAGGHADDLLTSTLLTLTAPVLMAPAMHTEMWQHPATAANVATLRARGIHVLDPDSGRLTGSDTGPGRLPEPEAIMAAALALVPPAARAGEPGAPAGPLGGRTVAISAGGTREPLDPVRFLGNRSSGRQGLALARAAVAAGARVRLAAANVDAGLLAGLPRGVEVRAVETTAELDRAMTAWAADADLLVMAAAVADYRPARPAAAKLKKTAGPPTIELVQNPDILAGLVAGRRPGQVIVGFAAETGDDAGSVLEHGRTKARSKGADLLAVNEVGASAGFGDVPNRVTLVDSSGRVRGEAHGSKDDVAAALLDVAAALLAPSAD
ncbi:bifunctional phosphopantothenoylcysteine decarboxylase/phosphopantothenate--cysteine ligase CoaBC [Pseudactinotalea sp. HY160]|uniref:bifunctional phosphopantothenoylcysteine decarboxylase/phosphopantothenate--cysteine ligase CoaBC n=1 Tax=Pseudactinotalea sp. HY160 TaxID=2654490 RepID=UPI001313D25D|nr:bifunctional phosphopantothenoylcysteine decarboxylase/phosphopantothenate--cysteine ligase CoaBC [Pseudactinotalea sp. HY160]